MKTSMHSSENMTRDQLVARLRVVEGYLSAARELSLLGPAQSGGSPLEQDFVAHDALRMLDRSGTPAFIYGLEDGLRLLDANYAFAALTGYFGNDLWSLCVSDLLDVTLRPKLFRLLSRPRPDGFVETGAWHGRTKGGEIRRVVASGHDLTFQGRSARFVVLHQLPNRREPRQLVPQWVAALPAALYVRSPGGLIESWNAKAEALLGLTASQIVGKSEATLFPPESLPAIAELVASHLSQGQRIETQTQMRRTDGTLMQIGISAAPLTEQIGDPGSSVWLLHPVAPAQPQPQPVQAMSTKPEPSAREWKWECDAQLRFTHFAAGAPIEAEGTLADLLGKRLLDLPVQWASVELKRQYENSTRDRLPFQNIEVRLPATDGGHRNVELSAGPRFDAHGNFEGYHGVCRDLTHRRRQEAQLQLLATLLNATDDAVLSLSADLTILTWNSGATKLLGYERSQAIGKRFAILSSVEDGELISTVSACARESRPVLRRESRIRHQDSTDVGALMTCAPVQNARGHVLGMAVILRASRQTSAIQHNLQLRNAQLAQLLETAQIHQWELDPESGRMRYGESFARMLGYDIDAMPAGVGPFAGLLESTDAPSVLRAMRALQHGEAPDFDATFRVWKRSGELLWIRARARTQTDLARGPMQIIGTCQDVTDTRRQTHQQLVTGAIALAQEAVIFSVSADGVILSWSSAAEFMLGYRAAEVIGARHELMLDKEDHAAFATALTRLVHGEPHVTLATSLLRSDSSPFNASILMAPVRDESGAMHEVAMLVTPSAPAAENPSAHLVQDGTTPDKVPTLTATASMEDEASSSPETADSRFRSLVEAAHQAIWVTNPDGEMHMDSRSWQGYTGLTSDACKGTGWMNAVHPEDREYARLRWSAALASGSLYECPQRVLRADGQWRYMIARAVPIKDEHGKVREWIGIHTDITEQRNTEDALRQSEGRLQSILNSAAEGIVVIDGTGSIERLNLAAQRMFGYTPEDYWSLDLKHLIIELDREFAGEATKERYAAWLRRMIGSHRDLTGRRKDGELFPLELSVNEVSEGGQDTRFVAIVRDVTERKSWEARIFQLAYSDSLTGLPNRLLLVDRLEQAVAAAQRNKSLVGVLFFDFDGFKQVNDRYGHHCGDLLLKGMSDRIRNCVREIDTVSRLGGDEFVVVLPELRDGADAGAVARKITAALSQPYSIENHEISITLTAGISIYPHDGESAELLIRNADTAMYFAKESGKNGFRFYDASLQGLH